MLRPAGIAKTLVKAGLPEPLARKIQHARQPTVAKGWERYAREFDEDNGGFLGDEWSDPAEMGVDAAPEDVVDYLDRRVFAPFPSRTTRHGLTLFLRVVCRGLFILR